MATGDELPAALGAGWKEVRVPWSIKPVAHASVQR